MSHLQYLFTISIFFSKLCKLCHSYQLHKWQSDLSGTPPVVGRFPSRAANSSDSWTLFYVRSCLLLLLFLVQRDFKESHCDTFHVKKSPRWRTGALFCIKFISPYQHCSYQWDNLCHSPLNFCLSCLKIMEKSQLTKKKKFEVYKHNFFSEESVWQNPSPLDLLCSTGKKCHVIADDNLLPCTTYCW